MSPIPPRIRAKLAEDPFMKVCCMPGCGEIKVEWDHVWKYNNRQVQEVFSIVPLCTFHHRLGGLDRPYTQWVSLQRATDEELAKYPRVDWKQLRSYLDAKYS